MDEIEPNLKLNNNGYNDLIIDLNQTPLEAMKRQKVGSTRRSLHDRRALKRWGLQGPCY
jgi:hypothetical protein